MGSELAKLVCKIADIKAVPNSAAQIVSVEFTLGQRTWHKAFRLNYDRPISMEEFKREVVRAGPFPEQPEDFLAYVKQEADKPFEIEVEPPDNVSDSTDKVEP
jgi:hypothetical protein